MAQLVVAAITPPRDSPPHRLPLRHHQPSRGAEPLNPGSPTRRDDVLDLRHVPVGRRGLPPPDCCPPTRSGRPRTSPTSCAPACVFSKWSWCCPVLWRSSARVADVHRSRPSRGPLTAGKPYLESPGAASRSRPGPRTRVREVRAPGQVGEPGRLRLLVHLADVDAAADEIVPGGVDVLDRQVHPLKGPGLHRRDARDALPEMYRALRVRRASSAPTGRRRRRRSRRRAAIPDSDRSASPARHRRPAPSPPRAPCRSRRSPPSPSASRCLHRRCCSTWPPSIDCPRQKCVAVTDASRP